MAPLDAAQDDDRGAPPRVEDGSDPADAGGTGNPTGPAQRLVSTTEFAASIRRKYAADGFPDAYIGVDDAQLTHAYLKKYPAYASKVVDIYQGIEQSGATLPRFSAPPPGPIPPPQDPPMSLGQRATSAAITAFESPFTGAARMAKGIQQIGDMQTLPRSPSAEEAATGKLPADFGDAGPLPPPTVQQAAEPFANLLGGAMEMGTIPMVAAIALDPLTAVPALAVGMAAGQVGGKIAEEAGAPPAVVEIASNVAGLAAGGLVGHALVKGKAARIQGIQDLIEQVRTGRAAVDQQDIAASETLMHGDLASETGKVEHEQLEATRLEKLYSGMALNEGLRQLAEQHKQTALASRSPFDYVEQAGTIQKALPPPPPIPIAGLLPEVGEASPIPAPQEIIGRDAQGEPIYAPRVEQGRDPNAPPILAAESGASVPNIDVINGPPRIVAQVEDRTPALIGDVTTALEQQLTAPRGVTETPEDAATRLRPSVRQDMYTRLRDNPYQSGGMIDNGVVDDSGVEGRAYQQGFGADAIFRKIVGEGAKNPPPVKLITDVLKVWAETGAETAKDIPDAVHMDVRREGGYGPREFRQAYDRWMPEVRAAEDSLVKARAYSEGLQRVGEDQQAAAAGKGRLVEESRPVRAAAVEAEPGAPPPPISDEMPDFLQNLEADPGAEGGHDEISDQDALTHATTQLRHDSPATRAAFRERVFQAMPGEARSTVTSHQIAAALERGSKSKYREAAIGVAREDLAGPDSQQPELPGAEGVRGQEQPTPTFDLPFSLKGEAGSDPTEVKQQPSLWDRLKGEEGALYLTVSPDDPSGLKRWLGNQSKEFGHEEWFQQASDALEEGDHRSAYRIAAIASAKSQFGAVAAAQRDERTAPSREATAAREAAQSVVERAQASHRAQVEAELGMPLPKSVDVSPEGILTFQPGGKGVPALRARATDLTLAKSLAADITAGADPTQIIRMGTSGEVEPQFQMSKQIADQAVREFPNGTIEDLAELMGFDHLDPTNQRIEIARQFSRAYSNAGSLLGSLGRWTQANEDSFYQYAAVNETGKIGELGSVGALQASGITTPEGFVQWLGGHATPEQLDAMKFRLPSGIDLKNAAGELTTEAKTYARNWFRRSQRLHEVQTTIDRLVGEEGSALDRAVTAVTIAPQLNSDGQGRLGAFNSLTKAALIARPGTAIRNTISQSGRYASGMADEAVAGFFSLATGDRDQAAAHFRTLKFLGAGMTREGTSTTSLFKHPWAEGLQAIYDYTEASVRNLPPEDARKTLSLLADVPHQEARMLGSLALEGIKPDAPGAYSRYKLLSAMQHGLDQITRPEVRNTLTLFNRVQEHFFRASVFDAMMRSQIEAKGLDPLTELADDPLGLIAKLGIEEFDRMAGAAVSTALDYTFAADPMPGTAPALLLNAFQKIPIVSFLLQMGMPFPRFNFVSAPRWVWDHTPIAPVSDSILLGLSALRQDSSPIFRGRLFQMRQIQQQESVLTNMVGEIGRTKYDAAKYLSDFMAAKDGQRQAQITLKGIEERAGKSITLEALQPDIDRVTTELEAQKESAIIARAKWREASIRVTNLENQRGTAQQTVQNLQAVGAAKSPQEYFARIATGTAMTAAGYALWQWKAQQSTTPGSPDLQWYEFPTGHLPERLQDLAGVRGQNIDLRSEAPLIQHLFPADVLADVQAHTNWTGFDPTKAWDLHYWSQFMAEHYSGKYTSQKFVKDALEAYLTISPAAGSGRDLLDMLEGKSGQGLDLGSVQDAMLSMAGQYVARLSSPLGAINDIVGEFSSEDAKARIPDEGTPENHSALHEFLDPTLANIPGLRRVIPEKVSALTGEAIAGVDPLARQLGGLTKRLQNRVEQELNATGLGYGAAVPRQTGDREFDNEVSRQYSKLLEEHLPDVLENPDYKSMTPEQKRDILANGVPGSSAVFPQLKQAAFQLAVEKLGEEYKDRLTSPGVKAKQARWQAYVAEMDKELAPGVRDQREAEGAAAGQQQAPAEPGAPPPGLP